MITVLGSINVDLVLSLDRLPSVGETVLTDGVVEAVGGKGANQAIAAARDGAEVRFVGAVGSDAFGKTALAAMHRSGVETSGVETVAGPTGVAMVWVDRDGRNKIAVASGANGRLAPSAVERMSISPADTLVLQMEVPSGTIVAAIARAKAAGARVVLNLAPARPLPVEVLRQVDILVVNEVEAAELGQVLGLEIADHSARTVALAERLGITIVTTLGADGAVAAVKGGVTHRVPALPVKAVDTTGAGDCFVGVLTAALDRNLALPDAMRRAASAASLACTVLGAEPSFPSRDTTDAALARVAPRAG